MFSEMIFPIGIYKRFKYFKPIFNKETKLGTHVEVTEQYQFSDEQRKYIINQRLQLAVEFLKEFHKQKFHLVATDCNHIIVAEI